METEQSFELLPFFYNAAIDDSILLTNQLGAHSYLEDRNALNNFIDGNYHYFSDEKLDELLSKSFIAESYEFNSKVDLVSSKVASIVNKNLGLPSLFIVVPTLRCDHNCGYCQVSRVQQWKEGYDLSSSHIDSILHIIKGSSDKNLKIEFQGGEPMLALDFIEEFVHKADIQLSNHNVSYVICTALGSLDERIISLAKERDFYFSVSLDGPESLHRDNRDAPFNSYGNTVSNASRIKEELGGDRVSCLMTATKKSFEHPEEIVDEYLKQGLGSLFVRPLSPFGLASAKENIMGYSAKEYFEFYKRLLDYIIEINAEELFIEETALIHLKKIFRPYQSGFVDLQSPSGAITGALVFNYDGNVFSSDEARMLWESTKAPELVLGRVKDKCSTIFSYSNKTAFLADTFLSETPGCELCAYQPYCGADPMFHLSTQGDYIGDKSKSFFCELEQYMFSHILHLHENNRNASRIFDRWLMQ